jgi:predicted  nucleic acid-binding Zn-ribbon protein
MRAKRSVEELPEKGRITKVRSASRKVTSELNRIVGVRKDLEMAIADNETDRAKVSELVDEAQGKVEAGEVDYRAIKDLESQLTTYAKRLEKIDFEHAHLEEELGKARKGEQEHLEWLARSKREEERLISAYKERLREMGARVRELTDKRKDLCEEISPELLEAYRAASGRFGGLAVERLNGITPSICRVSLQASQQAQVSAAEDGVCECPYCHRILVVRED